MGPLLEAALVVDGLLDDLPADVRPRRRRVAELLAILEEERPLFDCELRLWCLRLRAEGLSLRAIARATGASKSSVARYLAAGPEGIDRVELHRERFARAADAQLAGLGALLAAGPAARACSRQQAASHSTGEARQRRSTSARRSAPRSSRPPRDRPAAGRASRHPGSGPRWHGPAGPRRCAG